MPTDSQIRIVKAHCNCCLGHTNHEVIAARKRTWPDSGGTYEDGSRAEEDFELLACRGCGSVSLRHSSWDSEDTNEEGVPISHINYYPPAISRQKPNWLVEFLFSLSFEQMEMRWIIDEIYAALHANLRRLALMGIRSLLDMVMTDKIGGEGSFAERLARFEKEGFVSSRQREQIFAMIEAGHAAAHRGYNPDKVDLEAIMDISENLIETIYVHPNRAARIVSKTPRRKSE